MAYRIKFTVRAIRDFRNIYSVIQAEHANAASQWPLSGSERRRLLEAFLSVCEWVHVYYRWRPNLPDEGDNHLMELAVAAGVDWIVTNNVADFRRAQLRFPKIGIIRPGEFIREMQL